MFTKPLHNRSKVMVLKTMGGCSSFLATGISISLVIFFMALEKYPGSLTVFTVFSFIYVSMLSFAFLGRKSYFYLFVSTFWFLGFWLKACLHLIIGYDFIEPTGLFDGSGNSWDKAIFVSAISGLAILVFRLIQLIVLHRFSCNITQLRESKSAIYKSENFYSLYRWYIWFFTVMAIGIVAYANFNLGIQQVGKVPELFLPYKLNAIISACLNLCIPLWIISLIHWDMNLTPNRCFRWRHVGLIIFESMSCSISILSRGTSLYHVIHYFPSLFFNREKLRISPGKLIAKYSVLIMTILITAAAVTKVRDFSYATSSASHSEIPAIYSRILSLVTDRWIGLEGVMAVSSHDKISAQDFKKELLSKPVYGHVSVFEHMSESIYIDPDYPKSDEQIFRSLPGLSAVLYYTHDIYLVFGGVLSLVLFFGLLEIVVSKFASSPLVTSFVSLNVANLLAQLLEFHTLLIQSVEMGISLVIIYVISKLLQSRVSKSSNVMQKAKVIKK